VKSLERIANRAAQTSTVEYTHALRAHLAAHNWDSDVVAHTHVAQEDGSFKVVTHPDYADRAFVHEYGSETTRPTAAIRRFSEGMGETYMHHFNAHFKGN
jgi:predicted transcriptional regulator